MLNRLSDRALTMVDQVEAGEELFLLLEELEEINNNRQQLLAEGLIDEAIDYYFLKELAFYRIFDQEIKKVKASGNLADFNWTIYPQKRAFDEQNQEFLENMLPAYKEKLAELAQQGDLIIEEMNNRQDEMFVVMVGYVQHGLNLDPISKLLAKVSDKFPRVRMNEEALKIFEEGDDQVEEEDQEDDAVKQPFDGIEELVG